MRTCSRCAQEKPKDAFGIHRGTVDGLSKICKPCRRGQDTANALTVISGPEKTCGRCHEVKDSAQDFYRRSSAPDGLNPWCKPCVNAFNAASRLRHADKAWVKDSGREHHLRRNFNMSVDQWEELFRSQGGRCRICGVEPGRRKFHTDHDRACCPGTKSCGKCVRGLLCHDCNPGIGHFKDDIRRLQAAIDYLLEWERQKA